MNDVRRAVVLVDIQNEYFASGGPLEIQYPDRNDSLAKIMTVLDLAEEQQLPVVMVQHTLPAEAPVFASGSENWDLHPEIVSRRQESWKFIEKNYASVFAGTDFEAWLNENNINTITLVGYMTNNCDLATAAAAEPLGINVEVLSDASGAIHVANEAGQAAAQQVHETLMTVLQSNFAAVATTEEWIQATQNATELPKGNLVSSAMDGKAAFAPVH